MREISCVESNELRTSLRPLSSITNWIGGRVIDPRLPALTATTWGREDGVGVMREELDDDGCRHFLLTEETER